MQVTKANGGTEIFDAEKLRQSIDRAGIPASLQTRVLQHVQEKLYDRIPTNKIYTTILDSLDRSIEPLNRAKYSLKQSIMQLGPTGYPFEDFVAKLLEAKGYQTKTRQILMGKCVNHEIDVLADIDGKHILIEAKFHNNSGTRSEIHVPLYVKSRFEDLKMQHHLDEAWVITNTKATSDAIAYSLCVGMKIISWSYPENDSLRDWVEKANLHPITILTTLSNSQKAILLENHIILCKDIKANPDILNVLHINHEQKAETNREVEIICTPHSYVFLT